MADETKDGNAVSDVVHYGRGRRLRSPALDEEIIRRLSLGHFLSDIARDEGFHRSSCYDWEDEDVDFARRLARAREQGEEALLDEAGQIADDGRNDWIERMNGDGDVEVVYNSDHVQRSKLRVETRLKMLAVKNPAKYGTNRVDVTSKGEKVQLNDIEREARIAGIMAEAAARRAEAERDGNA